MNALLMKAVKESDFEAVVEAIKIGADPSCEENGWNPLLWAACNGNEDIVRHLIKNQAHLKYKEQEEAANEGGDGDDEEEKDNFKPVPDPAKTGRHTPMHWASYHGHHKVVWILMKEKMNPLLQDIHGNNCIHQAAANSQIKVLKCFMQFGVDLNLKNARVHTPLDLATDPETRKLIQRGIKTTHCSGKKCNNSKFDFRNIQFYCENCGNFYCKLCSTKAWVFENKDSEVEERPVCRCDNCLNVIDSGEQNLRNAMESNEFETLDRVFSQIKDAETDADVKLFNRAEILHLKLEKELDIRNFIESVSHVDNYKTIRKSVTVLNNKYKDAEKLGVIVDPVLIEQINKCSHRLISERNLRFEMENMYVSAATKDTVEKLQGLIGLADEYQVENKYLESANSLCGKMEDNISARETL
jgi:ankyrin repeat protein